MSVVGNPNKYVVALRRFEKNANTCVSKSFSVGVIEILLSLFHHRRTPNIRRFALHSRRYRSVRCTTGTTAIRNLDTDVWQSEPTGRDQDDLAVAWDAPLLLGTGGRMIESLSHRRWRGLGR